MKGFTGEQILAWSGGRAVNSEVLDRDWREIRVERPAPLELCGPEDLGFFFSREYETELPKARAGILITGEPFVKPLEASGLPLWRKTLVIACSDPYLVMAELTAKFAPQLSSTAHLEAPHVREIHPSAVIHPTARIGDRVRIGANCVVDASAEVGDGCVLYPGVYVGPQARLGSECVLFPNVVIYELTQVGDRARIHAGSVIGADGFGYAPKRQGRQVTGHEKIHHLGRVVMGNDVEIGANTQVDRGTLGDTVLGDQVKLDNGVQIGHNCVLAEGAVVCGGTALAGRSRLGRYVYIGGNSGIANAVVVGDGAQVGALTLVTRDMPAGSNALGAPQREMREHLKAHALLNQLLEDRNKKRRG